MSKGYEKMLNRTAQPLKKKTRKKEEWPYRNEK
jgi:hypothetical protein